MIVELSHPSDPRFLLVDELPERVAIDPELGLMLVADDGERRRAGKPLLFAPGPVDVVYPQPDGFGTDWVRP
jgi:hypothetical protein